MLESNCPDLTLLARGKVRDIYSIPGEDDKLLFVASDRISAYDVILGNVSSTFFWAGLLVSLRLRYSVLILNLNHLFDPQHCPGIFS